MDWSAFFGPGSVVIITAIVAAVKRVASDVPDAYLPAIAIGAGVAWNVWIAHLLGVGLQDAGTQGFLYALVASGLYTSAKWIDRKMA